MGKFDGMLICTDLDGTLLKNDKSISRENMEAIEYFKSEGGYFTFVTGRMPVVVSDIFALVKPNAPFGCVNGAGLYDGTENKYIWTSSMPEGVMELVEMIDKTFPDVGIQVNTYNNIFFAKENETMRIYRELTGVDNLKCNYKDVKEPIAKILFGSEIDERILSIESSLKSHPFADRFDFIRSERTYYEILPKGISKGTSIIKLCEYLNIDINNTIAIGDYDNDVPMLKAAKTGIAVGNACQAAKDAADIITVSNEDNAIAKVIYEEAGIA